MGKNALFLCYFCNDHGNYDSLYLPLLAHFISITSPYLLYFFHRYIQNCIEEYLHYKITAELKLLSVYIRYMQYDNIFLYMLMKWVCLYISTECIIMIRLSSFADKHY